MDLQPTGASIHLFMSPTIRLVVDLFTQFPWIYSRRSYKQVCAKTTCCAWHLSEELETSPQFIGCCFVKAFVENTKGCQRKEATTTTSSSKLHRIAVNNSLLNESTEEPRKVKWDFHSKLALFLIRGQSVLFPIFHCSCCHWRTEKQFHSLFAAVTNRCFNFLPFPVIIMMNFSNPEHNNGGGFAGGGGASSSGDSFTVKRIMGRTPGLIKSKFLSVLDSSNGILNGISSKVRRN